MLRNQLKNFQNPIFLRYLVVGCVNTAFGYSQFAFLVYVGLPYPIASLIATIIGIIFTFKTHGKFVFHNTNPRLIWRFVSVYGFLYVLNVSSIYCLIKFLSNVYASSAVALVITSGVGFLLNRYFVYSTFKQPEPSLNPK